MNRYIGPCLFLVVTMIAGTAAGQDRGTVRGWKKSVGTVISYLSKGVGSGTGFVIDADGYVVTNHHVVDGAQSVEFYFSGTDKTDAEVVLTDDVLDLALLKLSGLDARLHPPLPLYSGERVEDGDDVYALGFPGTDAMSDDPKSVPELVTSRGEASSRDGKVTKVTKDQVGRDVIQISADITHGNSGGPLVDACGRVIGVNAFGHCAPERPWDCAKFAISHTELAKFLARTRSNPTMISTPCTPGGPVNPLLVGGIALAVLLGGAGLVVGIRHRDVVVQKFSRRPPPPDSRKPQQDGDKVPPPSAHFLLVGVAGPMLGSEIPLSSESVFIGRDPKVANVVLPPDTQGVSRRHLEVVVDNGGVQVRDSWSSRGTSIDGRKIEAGQWVKIAPGQTIDLGGPAIRFVIRG